MIKQPVTNDLPQLQSERLILRKVVQEDTVAYYHNLGSCAAVARGMLWNPHTDIVESAASIEKTLRRYKEGNCWRWAVTLKESTELIGIVELLRFDETEGSCSFAYMLGESYWGQGYGTELLRTVFHFAFDSLGIQVIRADHFADNPASGRAMEKAGMTCIGSVAEKYIKNGVPHDAILYELKRKDYM